jgi:hypothetical protein
MRLLRAAVVGLFATALAGCSGFPFASPTPIHGVFLDDQMSLEVDNATTLQVDLFVNGGRIVTIPSQMDLIEPAQVLPHLPWSAEVRSPGGRVLVSLVVRSGDVWRNMDGTEVLKGDGARVDLSCGRIDIVSGPPLLGPAPGPGNPDDCSP